jgi:hypothetical protein
VVCAIKIAKNRIGFVLVADTGRGVEPFVDRVEGAVGRVTDPFTRRVWG